MAGPLKTPPPYSVASVDHALQIATMLQLEGRLTVSDAAERLGIARSTAHRLLAMLVYRDFAVQDHSRAYHAGPVLELTTHSRSDAALLRQAALPHLRQLVDALGESANIIVRTAQTARFIASVECDQALRIGDRTGMVFPAYRVSGGLVLLAELDPEEVAALHETEDWADAPPPARLDKDLRTIARQGFAVNRELSEKGVVGIGVPVRGATGTALGSVSLSVPSVRYRATALRPLVGALRLAAAGIERDLAN